jgi:hypothetical protein
MHLHPSKFTGEVLMRVRETSLNSHDLTTIKGGLAPMMKLPLRRLCAA